MGIETAFRRSFVGLKRLLGVRGDSCTYYLTSFILAFIVPLESNDLSNLNILNPSRYSWRG